MTEIKSIENLAQEKSNFLAEMESLIDEQIFVDKIKSFVSAANEYIEQLEAENAELSEKLSKSEETRQSAQIYLDDAKERCRDEVQKLRGELSRCINKVAELMKDKERLDYILSFVDKTIHFSDGYWSDDTKKYNKFAIVLIDKEGVFQPIGIGQTLREAIDAAMPEFYEEGGE